MSEKIPNSRDLKIPRAFCAFLFCLTSVAVVSAQEIIPTAPISPIRIPELQNSPEDQEFELDTISSAPSIATWQEITKDVTGAEVSEILGSAGWGNEIGSNAVAKLPPDKSYSVYQRSIAAGVSNYLVIPEDNGQLQPIEFSAAVGPLQAHNVKWGAPTAEEIRNEILAGMQAAIDSLCSMRAKPTEITVKASAVGVLELEAKWLTSEVCS